MYTQNGRDKINFERNCHLKSTTDILCSNLLFSLFFILYTCNIFAQYIKHQLQITELRTSRKKVHLAVQI